MPTNPFLAPKLDDKEKRANPFLGIGLDDGPNLHAAAINAAEYQPGQMAKAQDLSRRVGVPAPVLARNPDEAARLDLQHRLDRIRTENPALASWLAEGDNLALAKDDLDGVSKVESVWSQYRDALNAGTLQATGGTLQAVGETMNPMRQILAGVPDSNPAKAALSESVIFDPVAEAGKNVAAAGQQAGKDAFEGVDAPVGYGDVLKHPWKYRGYIGRQVTQSLPAMAVAVGLRKPQLAADVMGVTTGGTAYAQDRADGVDPLTALTDAGTQGLIERGLGAVTFEVAQAPGLAAWKRVVGATGTEAATEGATGVGQYAAGQFITGQSIDQNQLLKAGAESFVMGAALGGPVGLVEAVVNHPRTQQAESSVQAADALESLQEAIAASTLAKSSPQAMASLVASLKAQGGPQEAYIGAEDFIALYQSPTEAYAAAEFLTGDSEALNVALAGNGDLAIPFEQYVPFLATDVGAMAVKKSKLQPEHLTVDEARAVDREALVAGIVDEIRAGLSSEPTTDTTAAEQDIMGELTATGRYSPGDAEQMAKLLPRFYQRIATATGRTLDEVRAKYPVSVLSDTIGERLRRTNPNAENLAVTPILDAIRTGKIPSKRDAYGPSLVEMLVQAGGVQDSGGELRAMDLHKAYPGKKEFDGYMRGAFIQPDGMTLDQAVTFAQERGFFRESDQNAPETLEINDLLELIRKDTHEDGAFPFEPANPAVASLRANALAWEQEMPGLLAEGETLADLFALSNADILARARESVREAYEQDGAQTSTPALREAALQGLALYQPADGAGKTARGSIQFPRAGIGNGESLIRLSETADATTFLHEMGHFYLEVLAAESTGPDASPALAADFGKILQWFGIPNAETWAAMDLEAKRPFHEQFARGFEKYLADGKAPAVGLRSAFRKFKQWFTAVYRDLTALKVDLSDDVRGVFDRLLATEDEINAAAQEAEFTPALPVEEARKLGMSEAALAKYQQTLEKAKEALGAKVLHAKFRETKAWYRAQVNAMRDVVKAEADAMPVYRAIAALRGKGSTVKLDKADLVQLVGEGSLSRFRGMYAVEGGEHLDTAAALLGYPTGESLIKALLNAKPKTEFVKGEADARVREANGDPMTDGTIGNLAMEALHNSRMAGALQAEMDLLAKLAGEQAPPPGAIREAAARVIASRTSRTLRPNQHLVAERKAANAAVKAATAGKYAEALAAKRQQAFNAALYSESIKRQADAARKVSFLKKAATDKARKRVGKSGKSYVAALDALLEGHELRKVSGKDVDRRQRLRAWVARVQESGSNTSVSEELLARVESERVTNVADLTFTQLDDLHESVKNLLHLATMKNLLRTKAGKIKWKDAKRQLKERLELQASGAHKGISQADRSVLESLGDLYEGGSNWVLQPETIIEWLDGGNAGPWHDILWEPSEDVEHLREGLQRKMGALLKTAFDALPKAERARLDDRAHIDSLDMTLSGHTILSALFNVGNESNYKKLKEGGYIDGDQVRQFTDAHLKEMFSHLTQAHVNLVQGVWDSVNSLWPDIVALEEEMNGFAPPKVEPTSLTVQTKDGPVEMRGGYMPVKYDPRGSRAGALADDEQAKRVLSGQMPVRASTSKGHTEKRTEFTAPLLLDYHAVLTQHLDGVMGDIAYRRFLPQMYRVLNDPELSRMVNARVGPGAVKALKQGFERGAVGSFSLAGPLFGPFQGVADNTLTNVAAAALGFRVPLALANIITAPILASSRVSPKWIALGYAEYYRNPLSSMRTIQAQSPMMLKRAEARTLEMQAMLATLRGKRGFRKGMIELSMSVHQWIVPLAENAIWLGAYKEAQAGGADLTESIRIADKAIRQTQTKHTAKDVSQAEGNPYLRPLMMFAGPLVVINNRLQESGLRGLRGDVKTPLQAVAVWLAMAAGGTWMFEVLMGRAPGDEDDDDDVDIKDWAIWCARKLGLLPFSAYPVLRDAAAKMDSGYARPSPLVDAANRLTQFGKTAIDSGLALFDSDEEVDDEKLVKDTVGAIGVTTGAPTNQLLRTGGYLIEVGTGRHTPSNPAEEAGYLMQGPPKDK